MIEIVKRDPCNNQIIIKNKIASNQIIRIDLMSEPLVKDRINQIKISNPIMAVNKKYRAVNKAIGKNHTVISALKEPPLIKCMMPHNLININHLLRTTTPSISQINSHQKDNSYLDETV